MVAANTRHVTGVRGVLSQLQLCWLFYCSSLSLHRLSSASAGGVSAEYKDRYRSLIFNLRDAKNPQLRQRVLQGEVDPHQLVRMSAAEMASKVG